MDLATLIKKTGHHLVEIRERALRNILCKLDHALLSVPDLVQEKMLFVYLLEWFNYPQVPMQVEVLELLGTLAKHPRAAEMLRDVGAVEFLSQLSQRVEPQLQALIDAILDLLFRLPELLPERAVGVALGEHLPPADVRDAVMIEDPEDKLGYFQRSSLKRPTNIHPQRVAVNESVRCLKFSTFPWLPLTVTDRHILSSNESSLRSPDFNLVQSTCDLLQDVIMLDFPAEIFLQRPGIAQNLLCLLKLGGDRSDGTYLSLQAIACLRRLCGSLRSRLRFHRDPCFCSAKRDTVSQNSSMSYSQEIRVAQQSLVSSEEECSPRPSVIGRPGQRARGDGQDGDAASPSGSSSSSGGSQRRAPPQSPAEGTHLELPEPEGEDTLELRLRQLSLAQFATAIVQDCVPLVKTESMKVFLRVLELLSEALPLLRDSVSEMVWEDGSLIGLELKEKLLSTMECLGDALHHYSSTPADSPEPSVIHRRMAYMGTAVFTIRLLQTLLPVEKATHNLPESLTAALLPLCMDTPFSAAFPSAHESAVAYLEQASSDDYSLYQRAVHMAQGMESTCTFLKELHSEGEKNWVELLELADQALNSLPCHKHLPVVKDCVEICSKLWKFSQANPTLQSESQRILLNLLAHPLQCVRVEAYVCCFAIVKACLGVHNAAKPVSAVSSGANFLLHMRVLYEISAFGLQDQAEKVNNSAKDILLFLLKGQLMMTPQAWNKCVEAFTPLLPILQGYVDTEDRLGKCVLLLSQPVGTDGGGTLPRVSALRAALRLLFTRQHAVRATAVQHVIQHLSSSSQPLLGRSMLSILPSLYLVKDTVDVTLSNTDKSYLKVESVNKLYNILTSETVDLILRKSAAEQLVVVLQDTAMHPVLRSLGLPDKAVSFIDGCVNGDMKFMDCLLEPCFAMMRKLVYADRSLRYSLSQQPQFLITLLRASLTVKERSGDVSEAAALMCLLLFHEMARMDVWTDDADGTSAHTVFSLPICVIRRYNFPFQPASHHAVSPYCTVLPQHSDLLAHKPAWEMLQFAWNRAWHAGVENLLKELEGHRGDVLEYLDELYMSAMQGTRLRASLTSTALRDCLSCIRNADSHNTVSSSLARIRFYLLTERLVLLPPDQGSRAVLRALAWRPAVERFLRVQPACPRDEKLLVDIVMFLNSYFQCQEAGAVVEDLRWVLELFLQQETKTLLDLLASREPAVRGGSEEEESHSRVRQRLQKELTGFLCTLLQCLHRTSDRSCLILARPLQTQLAVQLLQSLRVSDAPRFYGLPSLERTLRAAVCVSALPGWSTHSGGTDAPKLRQKYLSALLEVISSFYVEWGGNSTSFMGKGVTKNAVLCLLHLSHEMLVEDKDTDWMCLWSLRQNQTDEQAPSHLGLAWLIPLWVDREPEVRFASLGLGSSLTSTESGCHALAASCYNISGGLWGTLLNILLDPLECSMVRREAAFVLQNLVVMPMPPSMEVAKDFLWQSPCVHDELSGLSLVGLPALQALLYHCQFFQHISHTLSSCYLGRYSFDLSFSTTHSHPDSGMEDYEDSIEHWRGPSGPLQRNQVSASQSTSSTLILPEGSHEIHGLGFPSVRDPAPNAFTNRLTTQGQSETDTCTSVSSRESHAGPDSSERCSIVTPHLASAICGLLCNLLAVLPEFTLNAIRHQRILSSVTSLVRGAAVERCLIEVKAPASQPDDDDAKSQALSLLQLYSDFSKLLQTSLSVKPELLSQMDITEALLPNIITVIGLNTNQTDVRTRAALLHTSTDLFTLLATMLRADNSRVFPSVTSSLSSRWQSVSGALSICIRLSAEEPSLYTAAMRFLTVLMTEEARRRMQGAHLGCTSHTSLSDILNGPAGEQLCELLLQSFEKRPFQDPLKKVSARAVMALLASSPSAQSYALKAGLIDSCVEQMKRIQAQLHQESLKPPKAGNKKREERCLKELKMVAQILHNCLYQNDECKAAATDSRLVPVLHTLWPWLLPDDTQLEMALELLCVYTAGCTSACSAVCWSSAGQPSVQRSPASGSMMHCIMRLASHISPDNSSLQQLAFSLLTNLSMSRDCKGLLHKSNFLQCFLSLPLPNTRSRHLSPVLSSWLKLLLSLSFGEDGQQMILKLKGSLELLAELSQRKRLRDRPTALITLHNLCFSSANKPKVLANGKAVGVLVSCLVSSHPHICAIGASALWALLHNYQKAKVTLKSPSVKAKVEEAYTSARAEAEQCKDDPTRAYLLKCLENVSNLLNN